MPYVEGYKNDVFVSYARDDDLDDIDGQRWVSNFVKLLTAILRQRLACRDQLKVFWDQTALAANRVLDSALTEEAKQSAVFIAVCSPAYLSGEYTIRELEAFAEQSEGAEGLFVLEILAPFSTDLYHPAISKRTRFAFWRQSDGPGGIQMTLDPRADRNGYMQAITRFVDQIKNRLIEMKHRAGVDAGLHSAVAQLQKLEDPGPARGTVLLAQTTDDLEYDREQVRSALAQFDITVLPEFDYPQGGNDFRDAFSADLDRTDLFVQLLGRAAGRMPTDMPDGYPYYQFETARSAGKPILSWRHPEINLNEVSNPRHRELLSGDTVMVSGLESFKSDILRSIDGLHQVPKERRNSLIFVGAERSDLPIAEQLSAALTKRNLPVAVPIYEGTAEDIQRDLEENLMDSDTILFVHGAAPATWVRSFLRRFNKLLAMRETPPSKTALIRAPPPKLGKLGITLPYLEVIDCSEDLDIDRVVETIEARA